MEQITHPQLVAALVKNPLDIHMTLSPRSIDLWHGATGVAGEAGELLEGIMAPRQSLADARENVMEESGDIYFYTEQLVQRTGIQIDWAAIDLNARNNIISPDMAEFYGSQVAIYGSQVLDTVKKCSVYNKPLDDFMLAAQLTSMLINVVTLGYMFGVSREQALEANIAKLSKRYEGLKYTDQAAHDRKDKVIERNFFGKADSEQVQG